MESEATTRDLCVVKDEPASEPTAQTPQPVVTIVDQPVENVGYRIHSEIHALP